MIAQAPRAPERLCTQRHTCRNLFIKIGSSSLVDPAQGLRTESFDTVAGLAALACQHGLQPIIISSGVIAIGRQLLAAECSDRQNSGAITRAQVARAGQRRISATWTKTLARYRLTPHIRYLIDSELETLTESVHTCRSRNEILILNGDDARHSERDTVTRENDGFTTHCALRLGAAGAIFFSQRQSSALGTGGLATKRSAVNALFRGGIAVKICELGHPGIKEWVAKIEGGG